MKDFMSVKIIEFVPLHPKGVTKENTFDGSRGKLISVTHIMGKTKAANGPQSSQIRWFAI